MEAGGYYGVRDEERRGDKRREQEEEEEELEELEGEKERQVAGRAKQRPLASISWSQNQREET